MRNPFQINLQEQETHNVCAVTYLYPIGSRYGTYIIWLIFTVNVGKYTIHGSYGYATFGRPNASL